MSKRFVVVYEALADFTQATELADRVLIDQIAWLDETLLDSQRQWVRDHPDGEYLTWRSIKRPASELGIKVHGHFDGEPGLADAKAASRAIPYIRKQFRSVDAILLIRDQDDQPERRRGLEQARAQHGKGLQVVIGLANAKRECWVLSGFVPGDEAEMEGLDAERRRLGFDPCERSHELTASETGAKRCAKRALKALTNGDWERERRCWTVTSLEVLAKLGGKNGLETYLSEVRESLAPLVEGQGSAMRP